MRIINYWEQFLSTGKIDDYLAYREEQADELKAAGPKENEGAGKSAGTGLGYRDHFKSGTDQGI